MTKGKTRSRCARFDILKANERNARRKARPKAKIYDLHKYDGSDPDNLEAMSA